MKKSLILAIAGILAGGAIASAANLEGQFSVSPVIGGYTYEGRQHLDTSLVYGLRAGYNVTKHFGIEALYDFVNTEPTKAKNDIKMHRYGGELLYNFIPDNAFVPYLAVGFAGLNFDGSGLDHKVRGAFDYGVGAKYFLNDSFALRGDVRHIIYSMNNRTNNNVEYTLGAYIPFGGVKPAVAAVEPPPAPAPVAEPAPAPKAIEPPPAPPAAPTATLSVSPAMVTQGQAATLNWKSQNATGCVIQPGIGSVPPQGARAIVPDASTTYNMTCSGAGGTAASAAGITVVTPPPALAPVVKPEASPERFCSKPAVININFDTNKSDIKPQYEADLNNVGTFLKDFPKAKGEISGHTDNVASKAYNEKLSQARADSVKKYLVNKMGIVAERISAKGYGFSKPVASNKTKAGKAKNRRIEANFTCE